MMQTFLRELSTQCRVIFALIMREVHTLYGKTKLGYLWAIITTAIGIATMWVLRSFGHFAPPHGLSILSFLVAGYSIFGIIRGGILKGMTAIEANKALLTYPQVSSVDVFIARCIVIICTEFISGALIIFVGYVFGQEFYISNTGGLLFCLASSFFFSLGMGMIASSFATYFPVIQRILPIIFSFLMFASGVMFSVAPFAARIGEWILWNPILQIIEYTRTCISHGYPSEFVSLSYITQVTFYSLSFGFLLERYTRKRLQA